jgi:phosphatidylserine/phosphatidylglycerophosphate/cardiolipin synthase-like enzyme
MKDIMLSLKKLTSFLIPLFPFLIADINASLLRDLKSELKIIKKLERKLSLRTHFNFVKKNFLNPIPMYQQVSIDHCNLTLKTYAEEGLIFKDIYDLSKVKIYKKLKTIDGTFILGFGRKSLMKKRMGLFFNERAKRDQFVKPYHQLSSSCKKRPIASIMKKRRNKKRKTTPPVFIGRIPKGTEETAGRIYDENANIQMAHLYGEMSFLERYESIEKAKKSIFIQSLLFRGDEVGKIIGEKLIKKRAKGLDVRLTVDGLGSYYFDAPKIKVYKKNTHILYNNLMAAGIRVFGYSCQFAPFKNEGRGIDLDKLTHRNHDKVWLVDSETPEDPNALGIVGGINFAAEYFRLSGKQKENWRDHDVGIKGNIIKDIRGSFLRIYKEKLLRYRTSHHDKKCLNPYHPLEEKPQYLQFKKSKTKSYHKYSRKNKITARISKKRIHKLIKERTSLYNDPFGPVVPFPNYQLIEGSRFIHARPDEGETFILKTYHQLIRDARESILIANAYFLPSPEIIQDLLDAAKRGVQIKILSNHAKVHQLNMITIVGRSYYFDLKSKFPDSIRIFEWIGKKPFEQGPSHETMHSKYMVVDDQVGLVGSHNLDYSSQNNSETAILFESNTLGEELSGYYHKLLDYSIEPDLEVLHYYKYPRGKDLIKLKILKLIEHRL